MATQTQAADRHTAVTTGWTNPSNAYATTGDNVYATALPGKSLTVNGDFGFPSLSLPSDAVIDAVRIVVEWGMSASVTGGTLGVQGRNNGVTDSAAEVTKTVITEAQSTFTFGTKPSVADLNTAGRVVARVRGSKGNTNTAMTCNLDFVRLEVDYHPSRTTSDTLGTTDAVADSKRRTSGLTKQLTALQIADGAKVVFLLDENSSSHTDLVAGDVESDAWGGGSFPGQHHLSRAGLGMAEAGFYETLKSDPSSTVIPCGFLVTKTTGPASGVTSAAGATNQSFALECAIKFPATAGQMNQIDIWRPSVVGSSFWDFLLYQWDGSSANANFYARHTDGATEPAATVPKIVDGLFHHLVFEFDGPANKLYLYLDGVAILDGVSAGTANSMSYNGIFTGFYDPFFAGGNGYINYSGNSTFGITNVAAYVGRLGATKALEHYTAMVTPNTGDDILIFTDSANAVKNPKFAVETLGTSDAATIPTSPNKTAADTLGTSDSATRAAATRSRTTADTLGTSDVATRTALLVRLVTADTLGTSDTATRAAVTRARTTADTLGTSDVATRVGSYARTTADTLGTSDSATRAAAVRSRTSSDSLGTSDSASRAAASRVRTATDSLGTSDAAVGVFTPGVQVRTASDSLGTSDQATRAAVAPRTGADTLGTSDSATRAAISRSRTSADTLGTSDSATRAAASQVRASADTLGTSDAATRASLQRLRATADTLGTSDAATRTTQTLTRTTADTVGTSDAATRGAILRARTSADTLGTSDAATRAAATRARTTADTLGTSDAASAVFTPGTLTRTAADTLGTADSTTRVGSYARTTADTLGTSDAAARTISLPRTTGDRLMPVNMIENSGGEVDASLWTPHPASGGWTAQTVARSTAWSDTGDASLHMTGTNNAGANGGAGLRPVRADGGVTVGGRFPVIPGRTYYVEATVNVITRSGTLSTRVFVDYWTAAYAFITQTFFAAPSPTGTGVQKISGTFVPPAGTALVDFIPLTGADLGQSYDFYVDSMILAESPAAIPYNAYGEVDAATQNVSLPRTTADTLGTSDAATRQVQVARTTNDVLGTSDAATRQAQTVVRTTNDVLGTSDAAVRILAGSRTTADTLGTSDAATRAAATRARTATDTLGTSDAAARTTSRARTATDTLGTSDAAVRALVFARTGADTLGTSDSATRVVVQSRSTADSLGTSDAATRLAQTGVRTSADTLGTSDLAARTLQAFTRTASDSLIFTDSATRTQARVRTSADTLGTSDAATRPAQAFARTSVDTLGTSDAALMFGGTSRGAFDSLGTSDAAVRAALLRTRTSTDTLGTSDAATRAAVTRLRTATDTLGTSDAATRQVARLRTSSDTLGTSDAATRSQAPLARTASDTLGTSDSSTGGLLFSRTASDSLGTSDAVVHSVLYSRLASDTLGTHDAATGVTTYVAATVTLTSGPTPTKISKVLGYDTTTFTWGTDLPFDEFYVAVVPNEAAPFGTATPIPALHGSVNMHGSAGPYDPASDIESVIEGADLELASAGDGDKIVRVFVRRGTTWSGS